MLNSPNKLPVLEAFCQETTPGENVLKNTDAPFGWPHDV